METKKTVLIVDDEEDLTWSISRSLKRGNKSLDVICVNSGSEGLQVLRSRKVNVLVTDLRMPGVDGFDLVKFVYDMKLTTKIIVITAYGSSELQHQILITNGCQYIEKPFEMPDLKQKIYTILNRDSFDAMDEDVRSQVKRLLAMTKSVNNLRVSVFHENKTGRLFFSNGEIYRAELDKMKGAEAVREILSWKSCLLKAETLLASSDYSKVTEPLI